MVGSFLAPKWPTQVPFCRMYHQKSTFSLILAPFLSEAAEASQCYFFENWLMKLKCPILLKPLDTMIQRNYWSFYPSEPFRITRFTMRHPVHNFPKNVIFYQILLHSFNIWPLLFFFYFSLKLNKNRKEQKHNCSEETIYSLVPYVSSLSISVFSI